MNEEHILSRIITLTAETLRMDRERIKSFSRFEYDLGADDADMATLAFRVAFEFDRPELAGELLRCKTVGLMVALITGAEVQA